MGGGTVRAGATILQPPSRANGRSRSGRRVELQLRLDGRLVVWGGERNLVTTEAPADPVQLRALEPARGDVGSAAPSAATASADYPLAADQAGLRPLRTAAARATDTITDPLT